MRSLNRYPWFGLAAVFVLVLALCMSALVRRCPHSPSLLRPRAPQALQTRGFGGSTVSNKAIPFSLRSSTADSGAKTSKDDGKVLLMLMFGKPGAGKGTLSQRLVKKYEILSLSAGDLLRQHIAEK